MGLFSRMDTFELFTFCILAAGTVFVIALNFIYGEKYDDLGQTEGTSEND